MKIFFSYSRDDKENVNRVYQVAESRGYDVFIDHEINRGGDFREEILARLKESDCVITFWSKNAVNSRYVIDEAEYAMGRGILIPVMLDETLPPLGFGDINAANLSEWSGDNKDSELNKLFEAVEWISGKDIDEIGEIRKGLNKILDPIPRKDYREFKHAQSDLNEAVVELLGEVKDIQRKTAESMIEQNRKASTLFRRIAVVGGTFLFILGLYGYYLFYHVTHDVAVLSHALTRSSSILSEVLPRVTSDFRDLTHSARHIDAEFTDYVARRWRLEELDAGEATGDEPAKPAPLGEGK